MTAADIIEKSQDAILAEWKELTERTVPAAIDKDHLALLDDLPEILRCIADSLRNRSFVKRREDASRAGARHGSQRARLRDYTLKQVLQEYHLLRRCVFAACEREAPLAQSDRDIIMDCFDQAVIEAAEEFSEDRFVGEQSARRKAESERDHSLEQVRGLKDEAGRREDFVAALSHDLRNPIAVAKMALELLLSEPHVGEGNSKFSDLINRSLDRAETLIRNLLDVSLIRSGKKLSLQIRPCDLRSLAGEAVKDLGPEFKDRIRLQCNEPCNGEWDGDGLRRVIGNLLTNALKYGMPDAPVNIRLSQSGGMTTIEVHNEGDPISDADQTTLFEPYFRTAKAAERDAPGWGLGLAFVKGMAEAHGGSIEVKSGGKDGTTFLVILPAKSNP